MCRGVEGVALRARSGGLKGRREWDGSARFEVVDKKRRQETKAKGLQAW